MFRSAPIVGGRRGTRIPNSLRVSVKTLFSAGPRLNAEPKPGFFASADPFRAEHVLKHCDDRPEPFDYLPEEGDQAVRGEFVISEDIPGRAVCIYVRGVQVIQVGYCERLKDALYVRLNKGDLSYKDQKEFERIKDWLVFEYHR